MVFVPNSFLLAIEFFPALDLLLCFLLLPHDGLSEIACLGFEFKEGLMSFLPNLSEEGSTLALYSWSCLTLSLTPLIKSILV